MIHRECSRSLFPFLPLRVDRFGGGARDASGGAGVRSRLPSRHRRCRSGMSRRTVVGGRIPLREVPHPIRGVGPLGVPHGKRLRPLA